jgi:hypothetical protein
VTAVFAAEVLADPVGVMVGLIEAREPGLEHDVITAIVEQLAGGRAKRRRLAQALLDRPGVLTTVVPRHRGCSAIS